MKIKFLALSVSLCSLFFACTDDTSDEYCENPDAVCPDETSVEATACCTNEDCYWTYNNQNYECNGSDCSDVLDVILADACETTSNASASSVKSTESLEILKAKLQSVTDRLMAESIASCPGCN